MKNFKKRTVLIGLIFLLIVSLVTPFNIQQAEAAEETITVAEAIAINSGSATVQGYIVGFTTGTNSITNDSSKFKDDNNLVLADNPKETNINNVIPVQLTSSYRSEFGLSTNPDHVGKKVKITGSLEPYFSMPGLKSPTNIEFMEDGEVEEEVPPSPLTAEKGYTFNNLTTNKIVLTKPSISLTLGENTNISNGVLFTGNFAEFNGNGFANTSVWINPLSSNAVIDFNNTIIKEITIDGNNVKQIHALHADAEIDYIKGASKEDIQYFDINGQPIEDNPTVPDENQAPIAQKEIANSTITTGETLTFYLPEYFSDPDNDELTFTSTKGTIENATLALALEEGSHIVGVTATDGEESVTISFTVTVRAETGEESPLDIYYQDALGKEGQALKDALHEIIDDHHQLTYSQAWDAIKDSDEDPNNPDNVILFYSGVSRSKDRNGGMVGDWNREHTWAKSHGNFGTSMGPGTDVHHLRPTDTQVNSSRGNLDFDYGGSSVKNCDECKRDGDSFEPPDRVKGDVARILFYMATRYEQGDRVDLELNERVNNGSAPYHGKLSVLLEWNAQDPVDEFERNRNNVIERWQGNRNPFIDHPEWANAIWNNN